MNSAKLTVGRCAGLAFIIALLFTPVFGQGPSSGMTGTVKDTKGNRIRGAEVTVSNSKIGVKQKRTTKDDGVFTVLGLRPNQYTVVVEKAGFKRFEKAIPLPPMTPLLDTSPLNLSSNPSGQGVEANITVDLSIVLIPETQVDNSVPQDRTMSDIGNFAVIVPQVQNQPIATSNTVPPAQSQNSQEIPDAGRLQLQSLSGERSDLITNKQVVNLALNGRDLLDLFKLVPGVSSTFDGQLSRPDGLNNFNINGTRGIQHELVIDGISNVDTGDNATRHVTINPDAVAEIKLLTANYQAEYGKAAGGFIQIVTKSGTTDFHGGARFFHRHEGLNANNYFNNISGRRANGAEIRPRPLYRYNAFGYEIGGPVYVPRFGEGGSPVRKLNNLFFYVNQEFYRQLIPAPERLIRVPTAEEREGNFSKTGVNIIDPITKLPFPGNIIPQDRWFGSGQAILKLFPEPNLNQPINGNNFRSQLPHDSPRREDIVRLDYKPNDKTDIAARVVNNSDEQRTNYGAFPVSLNFPITLVNFNRPGLNVGFTVSYAFNEKTINEIIIGLSRSRSRLAAGDNRLTRAANNLNFPLLFPDANRGDYIPSFRFGGVNGPTTEFLGAPRDSFNQTINFSDNLTWIWRNHTFKGGIFIQHARKDETATGLPFYLSSLIDFNGEANFPDNARHPFANALLGNYAGYDQVNNAPKGFFRYLNVEGYVQDLWRVNDRLAIELGLRVSWYQPQYDERLQLAVFNPAFFDAAKAAKLFQPILVNGQRMAVNPNDPKDIRPANFIGLLVPGSGDFANGIAQASKGYPRGGFDGRGAQFGPRVGFAYDLLGDGRTILRGGFGIFYDRVAGNQIRDLLTNPPTVFATKLFFGNLGDLEKLRPQDAANPLATLSSAPPTAVGYAKDGKIPNVYSFSLNVQRDIGWGTVVDVAYVGTLGRHLLQTRNLNAIPYGTTFSRNAQDPTLFGGNVPDSDPNISQAYKDAGLKFDGSRALPRDFLRPYFGYGDIFFREFIGSTNYNSLQISARRRFSRNLSFSLAYTWSKAYATANADRDVNSLVDPRGDYELTDYDYRLASYDRRHIFAASYVYALPELSRHLGGGRFWQLLLDGWRISGITQFSTGRPLELGTTLNGIAGGNSSGISSGQRLTGSYTDSLRFYTVGDPNRGSGVRRIDPLAFALPKLGDTGPWPRNYLTAPGINNHDLAVFKEVPLGKDGQYLQLRFEMFNAFNHTQFTNLNTSFNLNPSDQSIRFDAREGNYFVFSTPPKNFPAGCEPIAGTPTACLQRIDRSRDVLGRWFGEPTAARDPRVLQFGFKFYF